MIKLSAFIAMLTLSHAAFAAGPVDPDWPCIQRKQPKLSVAQLWSGPPIDATTQALANTDRLQPIARQLAARRTSIADAQTLISDFAGKNDAQSQIALFLATFEHIQSTRARVMAGISRYAHKQAALDADINTQRRHFNALQAAQPPDFDAIDKAEVAIDWSTRIFLDRQQSLTYVCETPVILEQRAFALARVFAQTLAASPPH